MSSLLMENGWASAVILIVWRGRFYCILFTHHRGGAPKVIAYLYGGQGTINTPSWSPESKRIAFVSNSGPVAK